MPAKKSTNTPADLRADFQELLHRAIIQGCLSAAHGGKLGPDTLAAIDRMAREHPDAGADLIAEAYDAFLREHG
jgi:hypothetical protein